MADPSASGPALAGATEGVRILSVDEDRAAVALHGREVLSSFLRASRAYELIPESGKVVVFDTDVPIRLAFYALVEHDVACAPLWDTARGRFSGALTTSDLCDIMRIFHVPGTQSTAAALSEFTIATWRSYACSMEGLRRGLSSSSLHRLQQQLLEEQRGLDAPLAAGRPESAAGSASGVAASSAAAASCMAMSVDASGHDAPSSSRSAEGGAGSGGSSGSGTGQGGGMAVDSGGGGGDAPPPQHGGSGSSVSSSSYSSSSVAAGSGGGGGGPSPSSLAADGAAAAASSGSGGPRRPVGGVYRGLIAIYPEDDLLTVVMKLRHFGIHHLPVLDDAQQAVVAVLSYRSLLAHLVRKFADPGSLPLFNMSLTELRVGSFGEDIVVVPESASVASVLHVLAERQISSVPIVAGDGSGVLVDVYSREDVAFLANDPTLMVLDAPVGDVRRAQISMTGIGSNLLTCFAHDTLSHAVALFAAAGGRAERLVCVDAERRVTGIVSLSDLFAYVAQDAIGVGFGDGGSCGGGGEAAAAGGFL